MRNLCQIFSRTPRKIYAIGLMLCLIWGLTPPAESISVKLRGKIALGGILSGLAYVTYALVTHDKRAAEKLQLHLGPPDRVIRYERGFDQWRINYYGEQCYLFRNNLFIKTVPCTSLQSDFLIEVPSHHLPLHYRQVSDMSLLSLFRGVVEVNQEPLRNGVEQSAKVKRSKKPFLIDTPVSRNPSGCGFTLRIHSEPLNLYLPVFIRWKSNVCLVGNRGFHIGGNENRI